MRHEALASSALTGAQHAIFASTVWGGTRRAMSQLADDGADRLESAQRRAPLVRGHMPKLTRVTLADSLLVQLRQQILSGRLRPGEPMPAEREICDAFGVGRSTVREALQGLVAGGFVQRRNNQLVTNDLHRLPADEIDYAALATQTSVEDVFETRKLLECRLVELAAAGWADEDLDEIRRALASMKDPVDEEAYHAGDVEFHLGIARIARRPVLAQVYESNLHLLFRLPGFWRAFRPRGEAAHPVGAGWAGHARVLDAIEARDGPAAALATFELLDRVQSDLVARVALARGGPPGGDEASPSAAVQERGP